MTHFYLKAFHIVFIVTWFAGLFYTPRLMVYAVEAATNKDEMEGKILLKHLLKWQKRLWLGITMPSAVITLFLGSSLFYNFYPDIPHWLSAILALKKGIY
jgi:protoporphyrinogen IX oxidase